MVDSDLHQDLKRIMGEEKRPTSHQTHFRDYFGSKNLTLHVSILQRYEVAPINDLLVSLSQTPVTICLQDTRMHFSV